MLRIAFCGGFICILTVNLSLCLAVATNTSCPLWHHYDYVEELCMCGFGLVCSNDGNQVEIENSNCATSSGQEDSYFFGECPFNPTINSINRMFSEMPSNASQLDDVMCGPYNRRGLLCGECKDGYGPAVYSLDMKCANCSDLWSGYAISLYVFLQFIPTTLIYICLVVFRFKITSGPLLGYVLFSQASTSSLTARQHFMYAYMESNLSLSVKILIKSAVTLSQFWCFQFFRTIIPPFCISEN